MKRGPQYNRFETNMAKFWRLRRSLIILVVVAIVDFVGRLALSFQMKRVALFEALLFAVAAILLIWPASCDRVFLINFCLALAFGLGSLRAGLWSAGLPVGLANLIVFGVFLLVLIGYAFRRWVLHRGTAG